MVGDLRMWRRVLVTLCASVVVAVGQAPAAEAAAVAPNPPGIGSPALTYVNVCEVKVDWVAPSGGEPPTSYVVNVWSLPRVDDRYGLPVDLQQAVVAAPTTEYAWRGLPPGRVYNVTVSSVNAHGSSEDTVLGSIGPLPVETDYADPCTGLSPTRPFAAGNWDAVIVRTYKDFLGRSPSPTELATWRASLTAGSPTAVVAKARRAGMAAQLAAVAERSDGPAYRLYSAYFAREPEFGGLTYWSAKLRGGTSPRTVSAYFAASSEFRNTYGSLDAAGFVTLVYRNVLGRAPEPTGFRYWVGQLQTGKASRASVMVGFSESSEHRTRLAFRISTTIAHVHMLRRMPTPAELQQAAAFHGQYPNAAVSTWFELLHWQIVDSASYRARGTTP